MNKSNCFESSVVKKPVINHINKTIVVSDLFFKEAAKPFTNEFYDLMKLREVLPDYEVITRSHRKPRPPKEPEKVKKFVSYTKMKTYIELLDNKDKLMEEFELVKAFAKTRRNSASIVFKWFNDKFPDYRKPPRLDENGKLIAEVKIISLEEVKKAAEEAEKAEAAKQVEAQATEGDNELSNAV